MIGSVQHPTVATANHEATVFGVANQRPNKNARDNGASRSANEQTDGNSFEEPRKNPGDD